MAGGIGDVIEEKEQFLVVAGRCRNGQRLLEFLAQNG
jgi:hypothetical protein